MEKRIRLSERLLALDAATARHKDKDGYLHVDISNLTPLDALNTLNRLQSKLRNRW